MVSRKTATADPPAEPLHLAGEVLLHFRRPQAHLANSLLASRYLDNADEEPMQVFEAPDRIQRD